MPKSRFAMYAPFLALALVQALFVALFPSTGDDRSVSASGFDSSEFGAPGGDQFGDTTFGDSGALDGAAAVDTDGDGVADAPGTAGGTTSGGAAATGGGTSGGQAGPTAPGSGGRENPVIAEGDTSHCTGERQMKVFAVDFENPECKPKLPAGADNGGATWTGVTKDTIKVVIIEPTPNEQVDAVLKSQGLAIDRRRPREASTRRPTASSTSTTRPTAARWSSCASVGNCPTSPPTCRRAWPTPARSSR